MHDIPPIPAIMLKLTSRCNLKCTYCYWFKDPDVYNHPAKLTLEAQEAFVRRVKEHIEAYQLSSFEIMFHGGEPMLFGKRRFIELLNALEKIKTGKKCKLIFSITTNAVLIDDDWANLFRIFEVMPCVSIDGPKSIHDGRRIDLKGKGTYERVLQGIDVLRKNGIEPSIVSVANPLSDPKLLFKTVVDDLDVKVFDIFIPDANYERDYVSIEKYYIALIDVWFEKYQSRGVKVLFLDSMIRGLSGMSSNTQFIGSGREGAVVVNPDGAIEPTDVLRIAGHDRTRTNISVFNNQLQDITKNQAWRNIFDQSFNLNEKCLSCRYRNACAGGHISQRWSLDNGYDNPSIYCPDFLKIFDHLSDKLITTGQKPTST